VSAEENLALVRAHYEALTRRDREAALATLAEDVDWEVMGPSSIPFAGPRHGRAAVGEFFAIIGRTVEVELFAAERMIAEGNTVVVFGRERFRVKATGRAWDVAWVQVHWIADGRIRRFREYTDTAAIAAAYAAG